MTGVVQEMGDLEALDPTLERSFRGHKGAVTSVAWNSNLKQLVSACLPCAVRSADALVAAVAGVRCPVVKTIW